MTNTEKIISGDLTSLFPEELSELSVSLGEKAFRGKQLFGWIHDKRVTDTSQMANIPKKLKEDLLKSDRDLVKLSTVERLISSEDGTRKYLFLLNDGNIIESVLMRYSYGNSVCISSQVGCRMGCSFCASTIDGLERNLSAGEMLSQVYAIEHDIGDKVGHVVVMGSGEPMDNYDNLVRFLKLLSHPDAKNLSLRNVTVSTCGIVPGIKKLSKERLGITLALSLHASSQEKRAALMPIANAYDIDEVITACSHYFEATSRRISFEYTLIEGVNDGEADAVQLARLLKDNMAHFPGDSHVNLIPVNPVCERNYRSTGKNGTIVFKDKLEKYGINVTIRREMGRDIDGACGQLRRRHLKGEP